MSDGDIDTRLDDLRNRLVAIEQRLQRWDSLIAKLEPLLNRSPLTTWSKFGSRG
jgi:hypothetical protein